MPRPEGKSVNQRPGLFKQGETTRNPIMLQRGQEALNYRPIWGSLNIDHHTIGTSQLLEKI